MVDPLERLGKLVPEIRTVFPPKTETTPGETEENEVFALTIGISDSQISVSHLMTRLMNAE
jgi:hypothetical protein